MIQIKNLFEIGDIVLTKSNGKAKVKEIVAYITKNEVSVQYLLDGFKNIFFYEEDLKLIQRRL